MVNLGKAKNRIKELLSEGYSKIEAIRTLKDEGFAPHTVDKAMDHVMKNEAVSDTEQSSEPSSEPAPEAEPSPEPELEQKEEMGPIPEAPHPSYYKQDTVTIDEDFLKEMEPLIREIRENRKLIERNTKRDKANYKKLSQREAGDIVKFQSRLAGMHEELKKEISEISSLREKMSDTNEMELLKKQVQENNELIRRNFTKDRKNFKRLKSDEVEDIVKFQSQLAKMHEELKQELTEISGLKEQISNKSDLDLLREQVQENRGLIRKNFAGDKRSYKRLKSDEVADIVKFQSKLEGMHEDLKKEISEITTLKQQLSDTTELENLKKHVQDISELIGKNFTKDRKNFKRLKSDEAGDFVKFRSKLEEMHEQLRKELADIANLKQQLSDTTELDIIKKQVEENKNLIEDNFSRDRENFMKLNMREVGDIVKFQGRLAKMQDELKHELTDITSLKENMNNDDLTAVKKQLEENRKLIEKNFSKDKTNFMKLKEHEIEDIVNFQVKLEGMHEELKESFKQVTDKMENFSSQMKSFETRMDEIRKIEDHIERLDLKQIRREIEILKTKEHWIVDNLEKLDMDPIFEKIQEVEHKINLLKATSPYVIE